MDQDSKSGFFASNKTLRTAQKIIPYIKERIPAIKSMMSRVYQQEDIGTETVSSVNIFEEFGSVLTHGQMAENFNTSLFQQLSAQTSKSSNVRKKATVFAANPDLLNLVGPMASQIGKSNSFASAEVEMLCKCDTKQFVEYIFNKYRTKIERGAIIQGFEEVKSELYALRKSLTERLILDFSGNLLETTEVLRAANALCSECEKLSLKTQNRISLLQDLSELLELKETSQQLLRKQESVARKRKVLIKIKEHNDKLDQIRREGTVYKETVTAYCVICECALFFEYLLKDVGNAVLLQTSYDNAKDILEKVRRQIHFVTRKVIIGKKVEAQHFQKHISDLIEIEKAARQMTQRSKGLSNYLKNILDEDCNILNRSLERIMDHSPQVLTSEYKNIIFALYRSKLSH